MKYFIIYLALAAVCQCADLDGSVAVTQDTSGAYSLKYDTKSSDREESRRADGTTVGRYGFVDPNGKRHDFQYVGAAEQGFNVQSSSLPVAPHQRKRRDAALGSPFEFQISRREFARALDEPVSTDAVLERLNNAIQVLNSRKPALSVQLQQPFGLENANLGRSALLIAHLDALRRLNEEYNRRV